MVNIRVTSGATPAFSTNRGVHRTSMYTAGCIRSHAGSWTGERAMPASLKKNVLYMRRKGTDGTLMPQMRDVTANMVEQCAQVSLFFEYADLTGKVTNYKYMYCISSQIQNLASCQSFGWWSAFIDTL